MSEKEEKKDKEEKPKEEEKKRRVVVTFHKIGHYLLDEVYRGKPMFCVYDLNKKDFSFEDKFTLPGLSVEYVPYACDELIEKRFMFLPQEPKEYGNTLDLTREIQDRLHGYIDYDIDFERLDPYYCLLTWLYDVFPVVPYRRALGYAFGIGKSRWQEILGSLCRLGYKIGAAATAADLFRLCDIIRGTAMIDETSFSQKTEQGQAMLQILNSGYSVQHGVVYRCVGEDNIPKPFVIYSPKLITARRKFDDPATESRTISHNSYETDRDDIPVLLTNHFYLDALPIRNKLLQWRFDNYAENMQFDKDFEALGLNPRLKEIFLPLVSIINDSDVKSRLIETTKELNIELVDAKALSLESSVLKAVIILWGEKALLSVKSIANITRELEKMKEESSFTPKTCGWYLRVRLGLKVSRARETPRPYVVERSDKNFVRLRRLVKKYDIQKEDIM